MKTIQSTLLESINHILQHHPELALSTKELADTALGNNRSGEKYFGLNGLDQKLEKWLDYDNGYFVEIGANDGISQSNTCYFERHRNWKGLLVEPVPHNYLSCKKHRSSANRVFCHACVSFDYCDKFVEIIYSNLMSTPKGVESDISDPFHHAESGKRFMRSTDENFVFGAPAATLNSLLKKAGAPKRIDLLSLDVEGGEIEVLKGIDHKEFRFKYLCIENRSPEKLIGYLESQDYAFLEKLSKHDYLFSDCLPS